MNSALIVECIAAVRTAVLARECEIESLDRAIGDGDHFINVRRGCEVLLELSPQLLPLAPDAAFNRIGMKLMSTIGGASGPLLASFFIAMGKSIAGMTEVDASAFARAFEAGVEAIKQRGQADLGHKTMLDVLIPVAQLLTRLTNESTPLAQLCAQIKTEAERGVLSTRDMIATKGRAHFLGERAIGHVDPGSKTCQVAIHAVCDLVSPR